MNDMKGNDENLLLDANRWTIVDKLVIKTSLDQLPQMINEL